MSEYVYAGLTSQTIDLFLGDSSSTTGAGRTGLAHNTAGLKCFYRKNGSGSPVEITLASQTPTGAWTSGGFCEISATNMPGIYRLDLPNAAVDTAGFVTLFIFGASNLVPTALRIDCRALPADLKLWRAATPAALVDTDRVPASVQMRVKKNSPLSGFQFVMVDSSDHVTPKSGLSVTAQRSIDGGAFSNCSNSVEEIGGGAYKINLSASDLNGDIIMLRFSASGGDTAFVTIATQP